jgi:uncharacterized protein YjbJ (UPF0337 family)
MNRDIVEGNWKQFKGMVQVRWGMLIGDYFSVISGRRTQSAGERQSAYGVILSKSLTGGMKIRCPVRAFSPNTKVIGNLQRKAPVLAIHTHAHH